jgi:hypothetical protein
MKITADDSVAELQSRELTGGLATFSVALLDHLPEPMPWQRMTTAGAAL